jgi:transposase
MRAWRAASAPSRPVIADDLDALDPQMNSSCARLLRSAQQALTAQQIAFKQAVIDKLTHEMAMLKRLKFAAKSEAFSAEQRACWTRRWTPTWRAWPPRSSAAAAAQDGRRQAAAQAPAAARAPAAPRRASRARRAPTCRCGSPMQRIGEDVAEKLDYQPGVFTVERHIRGKWVCRCCETLTQAPVPAHVIDKGIPTAGLLAQVLVAKFLDHLPLYRQEASSSAPATWHRPLDAGAVGGRVRRAAAAAGRCAGR